MRILHLVPGLSNPANGIAVAAKLIAAEQGADLADCRQVKDCTISQYDEVWVHSMWTPQVWTACRRVLQGVFLFLFSAAGLAFVLFCVRDRFAWLTHRLFPEESR